jgi:hypothetical protein
MMMGFLLLGRREGGGKKILQSLIDDGLPLTRARGKKKITKHVDGLLFTRARPLPKKSFTKHVDGLPF